MFSYRPRPILLGTDVHKGEPVWLAPEWLKTHVHMVGPPGSGKTRLILQLFTQLVRRLDATIILINPKGDLCRLARDTVINAGQAKRLLLFDPAEKENVIGYNMLRPNGLSVTTHAKAAREAIRSAWGQDSFDGTAQLARFLFLILCAARELELTLVEAVQLLRVGSVARRQLLWRLKDPFVREGLEYLDSLRDSRQEELTASTMARLEAFVMDDTIRRIITQQAHSLDLGEVIERKQILLVNLEQYKPLRPDDVKLLGRLLINDIVAHVFSRTGERTPVFLMIDECQTFTTQDLCLVLDQGRELGLHCVLAHQYPKQLLREDPSGLLYGSVTECARTKIVFGGMSVEHVEGIAKELFLSEFDPMNVKDEITSLELEPVESKRPSFSYGYADSNAYSMNRSNSESMGTMRGQTETHGEANAFGSSVAESTGSVLQSSQGEIVGIRADGTEVVLGTQSSSGASDMTSTTETKTENHTNSRSRSTQEATTQNNGVTEGTSWGTTHGVSSGVSLQPFYEYLKRYVVSSRTFWSFEEFLLTCMQRLKGQPLGHFVLKTPTGKPVFLRAPYVRTPLVSRRRLEPVLSRVFARPCYATPLQIEAEVLDRRRLFEAEPEVIAPAPKRRKSTERFSW